MTSIYFVRHAQPDRTVKNDRTRPLTDEGLHDSITVADLLQERNIDLLMSSPYKRSMDTIGELSKRLGLEIHTDENFRERNAGGWHGNNFLEFIKKQWTDFDYRIMDGENLREVQTRNVKALKRLLSENEGKNIVLATHGTALSTILNYYYPEYDYNCFMKIIDFMPFVIRVDFENGKAVNAQVELIIHKEYK